MDYEQKYEQKYREALGWMRSLYDGLHGATKEDAEHYFPELKENKSERVRKGLIKTISSLLDNTILYHTDITKEEALAWLEKQGKKTYAKLGQSEVTKTSDQELSDIIEPKKIDSNKVIAWLVANILNYEYYVKLFKKDFGL